MNAADGARLAAIVAKVSTVAAGRAVLGQVSEVLSHGYDQLSSIPTTSVGSFFFGSSSDGGTDTQNAARSLLDTVNNYRGRVYDRLPADDASQGNALALKDRTAIGTVLAQAGDAVQFIEKQIAGLDFDFFGGLETVLQTVGAAVGKGVQAVTNAAASGLWAFVRAAWPTLLIVLGFIALVLWVKWRGVKLAAKLGGGT